MNKKYYALVGSMVALLTPAIVMAATSQKLSDIIKTIIGYLNQALYLLMAVAIVIFVFYVVKYFMLPDADRSLAGKHVMYSVIGFFVVLSFWGIVNILQNTFGLQNGTNAPTDWGTMTNIFPGSSSGSSYDPMTNTGTNFGN